MILGAKNILAAAAQSNWTGAMAANVAEGTEVSPTVANDDDGFTNHIGGEKNLRVGGGGVHGRFLLPGMGEGFHQVARGEENGGRLGFPNWRSSVKKRGRG